MTDISSQGITVSGIKFDVHFYLGGDWKFIASVCGLDAANATFSCIWCKCAKTERHSLDSVWSIIDEEKAWKVNGMQKFPGQGPLKSRPFAI